MLEISSVDNPLEEIDDEISFLQLETKKIMQTAKKAVCLKIIFFTYFNFFTLLIPNKTRSHGRMFSFIEKATNVFSNYGNASAKLVIKFPLNQFKVF